MTAKIKFSFTPAPEDITRGLRAYAAKQPRNWVLLGVTAVAAVVLIGQLVPDSYDQYAPYGIFAGIIFVMYAGFIFLVNPLREGRRFGQSSTAQLEQVWTTSAYGLSVSVQAPDGRTGSKLIPWEKFKGVHQIWSYFLLQEVDSSAAVHIIPKRAFSSDKQRERFWALVMEETRKAQNAAREKRRSRGRK
jgi:hypothetical protein